MTKTRSAFQRSFSPIGVVACLLLLGCPSNLEYARLEAIRSFEGIIPPIVTQMRDALFPEAKGQPVGEKAAVPTRFLKNLDYEIEPTSTAEYPFLATLQVEMGGGESNSNEAKDGRGLLEKRYLLTLEFVQTRGTWRLYYSRVLSPTFLPANAEDKGRAEPLESFQNLLDSWEKTVPFYEKERV